LKVPSLDETTTCSELVGELDSVIVVSPPPPQPAAISAAAMAATKRA
jgi:hypothetical protein